MSFISFGDSWPAGEELLPNDQTFGQIIATKLGYDFINYSQSCTGVPHILLQLKKCLEENPVCKTTMLFSLSSASRSIYFNNSWKEIQVNEPDIVSKTYYKYLHSNQLDSLMFSTYILALQKMCSYYNINDYYVSCWSPVELFLPGINQEKIYPKTLVNILGCGAKSNDYEIKVDRKHETIIPNLCHPNALGHRLIADELFSWINHV